MEKEISFADSEHLGGQHKTFTSNCYECHRERRMLNAHATVNRVSEEGGNDGWQRSNQFDNYQSGDHS